MDNLRRFEPFTNLSYSSDPHSHSILGPRPLAGPSIAYEFDVWIPRRYAGERMSNRKSHKSVVIFILECTFHNTKKSCKRTTQKVQEVTGGGLIVY